MISNEKFRGPIAYKTYVDYPLGPLLSEPADWDYDMVMYVHSRIQWDVIIDPCPNLKVV